MMILFTRKGRLGSVFCSHNDRYDWDLGSRFGFFVHTTTATIATIGIWVRFDCDLVDGVIVLICFFSVNKTEPKLCGRRGRRVK